MNWRKWFGLDNGVVDDSGVPMCGCGHSKNYHYIYSCCIPSCMCQTFIQAKK